ncbi:hypothetical protein PVAP13_4NG054130 [Panicum virgatum]|uniref:Uncharacterized protein n=1 Tax=Panicum virgatum TaxID=38727 RepID=A0A8T0SZF9_PANVG|nr:hypothetical protein PVAP13_4NG054130 [Panicum virgatum]
MPGEGSVSEATMIHVAVSAASGTNLEVVNRHVLRREPCHRCLRPTTSSAQTRGHESLEPTRRGRRRHRPNGGTDDRRHHQRHPGREHRREQRRPRPHRGPDDAPAPAPAGPALELAEAEEEQQERGVGGKHEGHGARAALGAADGERRVARQHGEAGNRRRRRPPPVVHGLVSSVRRGTRVLETLNTRTQV